VQHVELSIGLSFDNPTTQIFDEMASVSSGLTDPDVGADQFSRLPLASRFVPCPEPVPFASPALSSGITRSPPAA